MMMGDSVIRNEITMLTGLGSGDLFDLFDCLSDSNHVKKTGRLEASEKRCLDYEELIAALKDERKVADKRSMLHLMAHVRCLEQHMCSMDKRTEEKLYVLLDSIGTPLYNIDKLQQRRSIVSPGNRKTQPRNK